MHNLNLTFYFFTNLVNEFCGVLNHNLFPIPILPIPISAADMLFPWPVSYSFPPPRVTLHAIPSEWPSVGCPNLPTPSFSSHPGYFLHSISFNF